MTPGSSKPNLAQTARTIFDGPCEANFFWRWFSSGHAFYMVRESPNLKGMR
jgi:hypothetical protein